MAGIMSREELKLYLVHSSDKGNVQMVRYMLSLLEEDIAKHGYVSSEEAHEVACVRIWIKQLTNKGRG